MANVSATSIRLGSPFTPMSYTKAGRTSPILSLGTTKAAFPSLRLSRFRVYCAAKPETVKKVMEIVKKQLALSDDVALTPESKLSVLGADSLDTVEIVMGLEEEFGISVEEDNSQNITTVQEAADLIEKLVQKKSEAAN
ncbi:acyl carrier protein 1, chloroplastic-like isoform X1 [Ananas comosus]|uniref:Acyl carrier protein n=2 Tax=Ananas comosus TaxID=4615 RepID=A0A6P5GZU7_ANACO|nr:acyl carrier protein 1, chloroplastic-like isoform X1 [Ananas comosus]